MAPVLSSTDSRIALPRSSPEVQAACAQALRTLLDAGETEARTIGVTSALRGEGRSTIAAGLALAFVRSLGRRCVLLDLDTDRWQGSSPSTGGGREMPSRVWEFVEWANADFGVLRLGGRVDAGTLTQASVGGALAELLDHEVDVVADLPPLPPMGSGDHFAGLLDAVVLVVQAGATSEGAARHAALSLANPPVVMLNRTASAIPRWLRGGRR